MPQPQVAEKIPLAASLNGLGEPVGGELDTLPIPPAMMAAIKRELADAVASGIEEGLRRVREENKTAMAVVVGATVVTALAAVVIAVMLATK